MRSLTGTGRLVRLALRRDRVVGPVWVVAIAGLMWATAASIVGLYQSVEERVAAATFAANSVILRIFDGPPAGTELGSLVLQEGYWLVAVLSALACSQAVVRHTRTEEESGRAELIGAAVVGRHARLGAGIIAASVVAVGVGIGVALVLVAVGLPAEGSTLTGATLTGVGLVFAGVAAVAAQVGSSARAANASAGGCLGAAWLLRAVGDAAGTVDDSGVAVVSAWPTWLSPIGWGQQAQPFSTGRWWVLALLAGVAVLLAVAAHALSVLRDVGAGMVAGRPGRSEASRWLRSPLGLAWRLHASTVVVWAVALVVVSAAFGGMGDSVDDLAGLSDEVRVMLEAIAPGGTLVDMFFAFTAGFMAIAASAFAVQVLLRIRSEELGGRAEHVLAARVSRHRHLASHGVVAAGGVVAIMVVASVSGGIAYGIVTGDWATGLQGQVGAALATLPAALVLAALVLLAVAAAPRAAAAIGWGALAASFVLGQLGAILDLPQQVLNLSPFTHVPAVPAQPFEATPMVALGATAIVLTAAAFVAHRRRDLVTAA